jgi:hypothetical protein
LPRRLLLALVAIPSLVGVLYIGDLFLGRHVLIAQCAKDGGIFEDRGLFGNSQCALAGSAAESEEVKRLLAALRQRLSDIDAASKSGAGLKPENDLDVTPLIGLPKETLRNALGPTSINCAIKPAVNVTTGERMRIAPCQDDQDLAYSFYSLPAGWAGGGPELLLQFDQRGMCTRALWRNTQ